MLKLASTAPNPGLMLTGIIISSHWEGSTRWLLLFPLTEGERGPQRGWVALLGPLGWSGRAAVCIHCTQKLCSDPSSATTRTWRKAPNLSETQLPSLKKEEKYRLHGLLRGYMG